MKSVLSFIWFVVWESFVLCCFAIFSLVLYCLATGMPSFMPPVSMEAMDQVWLRWLYAYGIAVGSVHLCSFLIERWLQSWQALQVSRGSAAGLVVGVLAFFLVVYKRYFLFLLRLFVTVTIWVSSYLAVRTGEPWSLMALIWMFGFFR